MTAWKQKCSQEWASERGESERDEERWGAGRVLLSSPAAAAAAAASASLEWLTVRKFRLSSAEERTDTSGCRHDTWHGLAPSFHEDVNASRRSELSEGFSRKRKAMEYMRKHPVQLSIVFLMGKYRLNYCWQDKRDALAELIRHFRSQVCF